MAKEFRPFPAPRILFDVLIHYAMLRVLVIGGSASPAAYLAQIVEQYFVVIYKVNYFLFLTLLIVMCKSQLRLCQLWCLRFSIKRIF